MLLLYAMVLLSSKANVWIDWCYSLFYYKVTYSAGYRSLYKIKYADIKLVK